ncbi:MAG: nucleotidyltransferase domain-containing protein [Taibaiella sp.]|nr:nucleotidyltransferase domain-containing protein [Taibaiella sp.]
MVALIKDNLKAIKDVCQKHHVRSLYLIGSAARQDSITTDSDIDFLYRLKTEDIAEMEYADNYFELLFSLQELLHRKVDLVAEEKMKNPYFIDSINKDKHIIYES